VSRREAPQDVAGALGVPPGEPIRVIRCTWSAGGEPVAVSTAYQPEGAPDASGSAPAPAGADPEAGAGLSFESLLSGLPAAAVSLEMSPPQPAVARSLRLSPGRPVITVTARFDGSQADHAAALTVVMLKPELFRVAIETAGTPAAAPS